MAGSLLEGASEDVFRATARKATYRDPARSRDPRMLSHEALHGAQSMRAPRERCPPKRVF
eukprot:9042452-Lingulodinium_polyedra.AAC.1